MLTEGEIAWDEHAADFDWARATAVPRALAGAYSEEPRYTDLRFAATSQHLSLRDPRFRDAVADVAAPLNGRAKDDMIGEEVRQHRRTLRIARAAGVSLAGLAAAASVAAVLAIRAADRADRERDRAEQEARVATSRQLAAQSTVAVRDGRLDSALTQAVQAWRTDRTSQARDALLAALKAAPNVVAMVPTRSADRAVFSADGRRAALQDSEDGTITVNDLADGRTVAAPLTAMRADIALDGPGTRLAVGRDDGRMLIWDLASGHRRSVGGPAPEPAFQKCCPPPVGARNPSFAPGGRRLAWSGPHAAVSLWDGRRTTRLRGPRVPGIEGWTVALGARHLVAAGAVSGEVVVWRADRIREPPRILPGRPPKSSEVEPGGHGAIAIGPGRRPLLAVGGADDGRVDIRDVATGKRLRVLRTGRGWVDSLAFSPSGRLLSAVDAAGVTVWEAASGRRLARFPLAGAELGATVRDDWRLVAVAFDGMLSLRDVGAGQQLARRLVGADAFVEPAFDRSGERVLSRDSRGRIRLWRTDDGRMGPPLTPIVAATGFVVLDDGRLVTCCADETAGTIPGEPAPPLAGEPAHIPSADGTPRRVAPETGASRDVAVGTGRSACGRRAARRPGSTSGTPRRPDAHVRHPTRTRPISARTAALSWSCWTMPSHGLWDVPGRRARIACRPPSGPTAFSPSGRLLGSSRPPTLRSICSTPGPAAGSARFRPARRWRHSLDQS